MSAIEANVLEPTSFALELPFEGTLTTSAQAAAGRELLSPTAQWLRLMADVSLSLM